MMIILKLQILHILKKYYTSYTNPDYSIENLKYMKNTNDDEKYKEDNSKHQDGNESVDNPETSDTSLNENVIKKTK